MAVNESNRVGAGHYFWMQSAKDGLKCYDLTHPNMLHILPSKPLIELRTKNLLRVTIDPRKTALVIVDMQNYFYSPELRHTPVDGAEETMSAIVNQAIPACRKAGIHIIWMGWGLRDSDIAELPPKLTERFGPRYDSAGQLEVPGLGCHIGPVKYHNDFKIPGGRALMTGYWNTASCFPLIKEVKRYDTQWYKTRMSAFWGKKTLQRDLTKSGITTLLFAGVDIAHSVGHNLRDAVDNGFDCLLLSKEFLTGSVESVLESQVDAYCGFVVRYDDFAEGVEEVYPYLPPPQVTPPRGRPPFDSRTPPPPYPRLASPFRSPLTPYPMSSSPLLAPLPQRRVLGLADLLDSSGSPGHRPLESSPQNQWW